MPAHEWKNMHEEWRKLRAGVSATLPSFVRRVALGCLFAAGCATSAEAQGPRPGVPRDHPHAALGRLVLDDSVPEFAMVPTIVTPRERRSALVAPGGRYEALMRADTLIVVVDRRTRLARAIRGLPIEWRMFSDLTWTDAHTLTFDRWATPHVGMHYVVDVSKGALIGAMAFHDRSVER